MNKRNLKILTIVMLILGIICFVYPIDFTKFVFGLSVCTAVIYLVFLGEKSLEPKPIEKKEIDPKGETNYSDYSNFCKEADVNPVSEETFNKIHKMSNVAVYIPTELDHLLGSQDILEQEESS